jgi:hypothetical protein
VIGLLLAVVAVVLSRGEACWGRRDCKVDIQARDNNQAHRTADSVRV